jgi:very-short-patch-repair endonuclease
MKERTVRPRAAVARRLRQNATEVEQLLWRALRTSALPYRFRRQHPVGRRVVDFACPARKLAIELDGGQHAANVVADAARTAELERHGYRASSGSGTMT